MLKLYKLSADRTYLHSAYNLLQPGLSGLRGRSKDCTLLCGDAGPLAVTAVVAQLLGSTYHKLRDDCMYRYVCKIVGFVYSMYAEEVF